MNISAVQVMEIAKTAKGLSSMQLDRILKTAPKLSQAELQKLMSLILALQGRFDEVSAEVEVRRTVVGKHKQYNRSKAMNVESKSKNSDELEAEVLINNI